MNVLSSLLPTIVKLTNEFAAIDNDRRRLLAELRDFIAVKSAAGQATKLNFICTHNSRRSHISQIWAQTAASYYGVRNIYCYSGGTEATAFNPRAVKAMRDAGFTIMMEKDGENPVYQVRYAEQEPALKVFSKRFDDPFNPKSGFAAIMTCSDADEKCPIVTGAERRIRLTYRDPKDFDGTPLEETKYAERVNKIGRELLYAFSLLNAK